MPKIYLSLLASFALSLAFAQEKEPKWDVANPTGNWEFQEHTFSTTEGTWMNLDISPDGKTIAFDLLGDIYTLPIEGGKAAAIATGLAFEIQPRFSPNGKQLSFTSDAGGGDNIWMMELDGSNKKQITKESFRLLNNAVWTVDGDYLIARKHFTSGRSLGAGEMWMFHKTGGSGIQLTKRKNDQQDVNEPSVSSDGRYLYYSEDMYPGGHFQYNKDPNKEIYVIKRYDLKSGNTEKITGGPGGAARPMVSPDGNLLAFVKRVRTKTVLYIHNLETGEEYPIYDQLNKDQQEAWAIFGVYPNFDWMPNNKEIVFWSGGKLNKIDIESRTVSNIPFEVDANIKIAKSLRFENPAFEGETKAKIIRHAITSPDEKVMVFHALGYLWKKHLPDGKPVRITDGKDFEFEPSFSPDGKRIVYVTWNDKTKGAIRTILLRGAKSKVISKEKGIFRMPSYHPNGKSIVYRKEGGNTDQGFAFTKTPGVYIQELNSENPQFVYRHGEFPIFDQSGERIFLQTGGSHFGNLTKSLKSVNVAGEDVQVHIKSKYANRLVPSPDNNWVAFIHLHKVYIAALPKTGNTLNIDNKSTAIPIAQVARDAGINLHWSKDSKNLHWTLGEEYFTNKITDRFTYLENAIDSIPPMDSVGTKVNLSFTADKPAGRMAFTGARIITMNGSEVIENGTILINGNRIESIGDEHMEIPNGTKSYDMSGKTIMPGLVDVHAHIGAFRHGLTPQKHWPFYANLAFGVTTAHDPSAHTETVFALSELVKSGELVGPRLFSTGFILYGADSDSKAVINGLDDARSAIRRTKAFGALSVKSYNQPRRDQRQQVIQAAREENIFVVPEGGSTFYHNMTMIMDGHTGIEHNIPVAPVYKDITELWSASNTGYTPTLIVNYGGVNAEYYWYQNTEVWKNEKLMKFYPRSIIDARSRHRTMIPQEEYENGHILVSKTCKQLSDAGVKVNLGAHGQLQGLGAHWELWSLAQGGMSPMEALRSATINGAYYIGMQKDIGSLEKGKLADLIILDKNPLEDIRNSESIRYTMVNGRLYDTETMNEIGNSTKERTKFYWENDSYNGAFPWHKESDSFMYQGCGCRH